MSIDSDDDFHALRRVGQLVGAALAAMEQAAAPGMSTADLDDFGGSLLKAAGARSAPQLVYGFPGFNLLSVNDEIVDDRDGWTIRTSNGALSAHFEETIVITRGAPIVLTALSA